MTAIEELLHRNAHRQEKGPGELSHQPTLRVAVLTCMDARLDLGALFGLQPGEAHVLRNAGGTLTDDMIRSLAISQRRLGTREILLVHHTGCGMTTFTDEDFAFDLHADTGLRPPWKARTFRDEREDVRRCMDRLRRSAFVRTDRGMRGFVVDVRSGDLHEVL